MSDNYRIVEGGPTAGARVTLIDSKTASAMMGEDLDASESWHIGHWLQTITGRAFYPLSPRAEDISATDIAHSLSMQCRYNGHVKKFFSVAEHCVLMSDWILEQPRREWTAGNMRRADFALWALLHDAAEAYIGDMVRPLKLHMPDYRAVDDAVTAVIAERFHLAGTALPPAVKMVDTRILLDERAALLTASPGEWAIGETQPLGVIIRGWSPEEAKIEYLTRLARLTGVVE